MLSDICALQPSTVPSQRREVTNDEGSLAMQFCGSVRFAGVYFYDTQVIKRPELQVQAACVRREKFIPEALDVSVGLCDAWRGYHPIVLLCGVVTELFVCQYVCELKTRECPAQFSAWYHQRLRDFRDVVQDVVCSTTRSSISTVRSSTSHHVLLQ